MAKYNVVFHYSVEVVADDEEQAESEAWSMFGSPDLNNDYFAVTVEEKGE